MASQLNDLNHFKNIEKEIGELAGQEEVDETAVNALLGNFKERLKENVQVSNSPNKG